MLAAALSLPLAGLALLLAVPDLDVHWEHHPSHFWLVLSVAFIDTVLGIAMSEAATRRDDARLFLVSMAPSRVPDSSRCTRSRRPRPS